MALLPVGWLLLRQVRGLRLDDAADCLARFRANRDVGLAVFAGARPRLAGLTRMSTLGDLLNPVRVLSDVWDELGILSERAMDRHLRLAVTGLSRSGKTVFITSVVQPSPGRQRPAVPAAGP